MTNVRSFLQESIDFHPKMEVQDAVKFLYQAQFGGGHLVKEPAITLDRLKKEYGETKYIPDAPLFEMVGENAARVNIAAAKGKLAPETLNKLFVLSSEEVSGTVEDFEESLGCLTCFFDKKQVKEYLEKYRAEGYPPVSHSESYKKNYSPAYRIVSFKYLRFLPLFMAIDSGNPSLVGIDGRCGSGKTTLSALLEKIYNCNIFHADDYFLQWEMRTEERLSAPGGNLDRERLYSEILVPVKEKKDVVYKKLLTPDLVFSDEIKVPYKNLTFVEGSYCLHPEISHMYDLKVFLDIDKETQTSRILHRNGEEALKIFQSRWIPMEEKYFETFSVRENCDIVIS